MTPVWFCFSNAIQHFSTNAILPIHLRAASSPSHQHECWKFCPYFRPRSNGISYRKLSLIPKSMSGISFLFCWHSSLPICLNVSVPWCRCLGLFSSPPVPSPVSDLIQSQEFQFFPQPWPLLDVGNCLLCIYRCRSTEISNLTCAKQSFQYCPSKLSSSIPLNKSYFWFFFFSQTTHPRYSERISSAASFKWRESENTYLSTTTGAGAAIFASVGLCQSLLTDYSDSTPSPIFLPGAAGISSSEFKLDNLIPMLRTIQVNLITPKTKA